MVSDAEGALTVSDMDDSASVDSRGDLSEEPAGRGGSAKLVVSSAQVMTAPVFAVVRGRHTALLQWEREEDGAPTPPADTQPARDAVARRELAAGDKETLQSPSSDLKDPAPVEASPRETPRQVLDEGATGARAGTEKDQAPAKGEDFLTTEWPVPHAPLPSEDEEDGAASAMTSERKTSLNAAQSEIRSDEDDDVFVSARESEASVMSRTSLGTKSA
eukprot:g35590.t1